MQPDSTGDVEEHGIDRGAHDDGRDGDDPTAPVRTARLLLCDDSTVERMALAHMLRREGYDVDEAADGESALQHLKYRPIDLLLLDLNMPELDGFGVLAYLQKHRPGLPVVLLSGMPLGQIQHKINRLPKPELPPLFIKPVDTDQLLQIVELELRGDLPTR